MGKDLERNGGYKHLTSQTADSPSPYKIISLDCSFFSTLLLIVQNYCDGLVLEAVTSERHAEKKSRKDEDSLQISLFIRG